MSRAVTQRYSDPADEIWLQTAKAIGLRVKRDESCFASSDGTGTLRLAPVKDLDADDCVAQMVFHEVCHSLVEGPEAFSKPDWGLRENDIEREHACLRLQAFLSAMFGLRKVLAPTTEHRSFYDALPMNPLTPTVSSGRLAISGVQRINKPPWSPHLVKALVATRDIALAIAPFAQENSIWAGLTHPPAAPSLGDLPFPDGTKTCSQCAWLQNGQCQKHEGLPCAPNFRACYRFEEDFSCLTCGACCRDAYHSVEVSRDDPFLKSHPEKTVDRGKYIELLRKGPRCAMLEGDLPAVHCVVYEDRPQTCRDFQKSGEHCLTARKRTHLSI